jgi:hypothetical protein
MGSRFKPGDRNNPDGFWEDLEFYDPVRKYIGAMISKGAYVTALQELVERRDTLAKLWGWKDPVTSQVMPIIREVLPDAYWVRTLRPEAETIRSMMKCYGWTRTDAINTFRTREHSITEGLEGVPKDRIQELDWSIIETGTFVEVLEAFLAPIRASMPVRVDETETEEVASVE